ncbi:hypothetical protein B9Q13_02825 [Candidatus Marsarchaeota G2 archaeon ECH_B_SAG-G16]|uniref:CdvA-like coiled-coil domain-containing protein n=5 Tax=Candidatus Marsarchaeota TaxID=1978152 RepID=A0A2R6AH15_9ARCH|nr:MAG: hypothetical protein B9Q01_03945 [Candidatus Marsarchaeota G1 archaeon OSP_D]PSN85667.1 MAG: hypothetical protein B9Q02_05335 [Candidatus Marsarchaeota G1 archaeon BE_D]PSN88385.1 MAG: hypothetical protein B9Q00_05725 [Candidatus Marsarchaeota G1 archaeon OSP_C]PSO05100.1 MAG: hypothetical protein B9Q13_02825 [Candidatus Marsarchaeota G2 archaeon ECH_B_SAG-G16]
MSGAGDALKEGFNPSKHLGKLVKDEYGRIIGRVAGFANYLPESEAPSRSKPTATLIVETSYGFEEYDLSRVVTANENFVVVRSEIKAELVETREKILWLYTRIQALESETDSSSVEEPVLTAAHIQHKSRFNQLVSYIRPLLEQAQRRVDKLRLEIEILERGLVELNIAKSTGEIKHDEFEKWSKILKDGLTAAHVELSDLEAEMKVLSKIELEYRNVFKVEILSGESGG